MRSQDIREQFLRFFEEREHQRLSSTSLIPHDDPSLLFTVAGMVPLKPYLSGQRTPPKPRLTSCQRCFRGSGMLDDITEVGDTSHHTFFEMLGNWSIGDYFKRETIEWAWALLTEGFHLDAARLLPSIYPDDEEALGIWTDVIGIPAARVSRMRDNWWQAGPTGPCGYDSEIYWDWGGPCSCGRSDCLPQDECGGNRWLEIWNLVFMEFTQAEDGSRSPLPHPCVDTGMGLERIASVLQGVHSDYETDLFAPIVAGFRSRATAPPNDARERSINVLADHLRGAAFLIADGVYPGNEGRGYVLRRVIRRAAIHGRRVGLTGGLTAGVSDLVEVMSGVYPELAEREQHVVRQLREEEEAFARTVEAAVQRLDVLLEGAGTIEGEDAFRLYDTFGLPIELTVEIAAERGVTVDREGFEAALAEQRARSKAATRVVGFEGSPAFPVATFVGYDTTVADSVVSHIGAAASRTELVVGERDQVVLDPTPFYAEAGGQIGDTGVLSWPGGRARVVNSRYAPGGVARLAEVEVLEGSLTAATTVQAVVDTDRRAQIARHHSATHLLHKSLREVLGDQVVQRGSYVGPEYTTFDFSFNRALTEVEIADVEARVNAAIRHNHARSVAVMPVAEARASGAMALFDEKYGDQVRVVDFGGWARELCGGTHVEHSGDIGAAMLLSETSIGQGTRRIHMVVGEAAVQEWEMRGRALHETAQLLRARPEEIPARVAQLLGEKRTFQRQLEEARRQSAGQELREADIEQVGDLRVASMLADDRGSAVVEVIDRLFSERLQGQGVAVVVGGDTLAVKVGGDAVRAGVHAGELVRRGAEAAGGRGGGRPEFARGGIKDPQQRQAVLLAIREALAERSH